MAKSTTRTSRRSTAQREPVEPEVQEQSAPAPAATAVATPPREEQSAPAPAAEKPQQQNDDVASFDAETNAKYEQVKGGKLYIKDLQQKYGMAVILITHDLTIVRQFSNYVYVMQNGAVQEHDRRSLAALEPGRVDARTRPATLADIEPGEQCLSSRSSRFAVHVASSVGCRCARQEP